MRANRPASPSRSSQSGSMDLGPRANHRQFAPDCRGPRLEVFLTDPDLLEEHLGQGDRDLRLLVRDRRDAQAFQRLPLVDIAGPDEHLQVRLEGQRRGDDRNSGRAIRERHQEELGPFDFRRREDLLAAGVTVNRTDALGVQPPDRIHIQVDDDGVDGKIPEDPGQGLADRAVAHHHGTRS